MSAPNIISATTINGKTAVLALTTSAATLLNNAASSGKALRVNFLSIANDDATAVTLTLNYYSQDDIGGTAYPLASALSIPANSTLILVGAGAPLYLEEDRSIGALASANTALTAVCSYEEIA